MNVFQNDLLSTETQGFLFTGFFKRRIIQRVFVWFVFELYRFCGLEGISGGRVENIGCIFEVGFQLAFRVFIIVARGQGLRVWFKECLFQLQYIYRLYFQFSVLYNLDAGICGRFYIERVEGRFQVVFGNDILGKIFFLFFINGIDWEFYLQ